VAAPSPSQVSRAAALRAQLRLDLEAQMKEKREGDARRKVLEREAAAKEEARLQAAQQRDTDGRLPAANTPPPGNRPLAMPAVSLVGRAASASPPPHTAAAQAAAAAAAHTQPQVLELLEQMQQQQMELQARLQEQQRVIHAMQQSLAAASSSGPPAAEPTAPAAASAPPSKHHAPIGFLEGTSRLIPVPKPKQYTVGGRSGARLRRRTPQQEGKRWLK
jgi:hypothetical protein